MTSQHNVCDFDQKLATLTEDEMAGITELLQQISKRLDRMEDSIIELQTSVTAIERTLFGNVVHTDQLQDRLCRPFELPIEYHGESLVDSSTSTCAICLSDTNLKSISTRRLWCGHVYHTRCIRHWTYVKTSCPLCRAPF